VCAIQPHGYLLGLGAPQADVDDVLGGVARDRHVVRHSLDLLAVPPLQALPPHAIHVAVHGPVELHLVDDVQAGHLPRVPKGQPVVRELHLVAVHDLLLEDAVVVAEPVAPRRVVQRRQRVHEAGRKTAQAAVPQGGVPLLLDEGLQLKAQLPEGLRIDPLQAQRQHRIAQRPPHQELQGQVVDALLVHLGVVLLRLVPPPDQLVPDRVRRRLVRRKLVAIEMGAGQRRHHVPHKRLLHRRDV
jgi:hypothetical protein